MHCCTEDKNRFDPKQHFTSLINTPFDISSSKPIILSATIRRSHTPYFLLPLETAARDSVLSSNPPCIGEQQSHFISLTNGLQMEVLPRCNIPQIQYLQPRQLERTCQRNHSIGHTRCQEIPTNSKRNYKCGNPFLLNSSPSHERTT